MKNSSIIEASRYVNQILPLKSDIYRNGSTVYSTFKNLVLSKEIPIPKFAYLRAGTLPEIQAIWYTSQNDLSYSLHLYRYDSSSLEVLTNFSTEILFVKIFKPTRGIFNQRISHCLVVCTYCDLIIYGIDNETQSIINTDFSCKLSSPPTCLEICQGNIFIGCENGKVYNAVYKSIDIFNYKYLNVYSAGSSVFSSISSIFRKKPAKITHISVGRKYLVAIGKNIEIYNVEGGMYKLKEISHELTSAVVGVQIVEENPLFFYCLNSNGTRDFFTESKILSLDPAVVESSESDKLVFTNDSSMLSVRSAAERSSFVFTCFNKDQLKNFSRSKPIENYEIFTIYNKIIDISISNKHVTVLTPTSVYEYSILDAKKFLLNCRAQEIYLMYKNFGDIEFMVNYFQLLTENEEINKLEGLCKNDNIKSHALFIWIYTLIKPIWNTSIHTLKANEDSELTLEYENILDDIIKKLKILKHRLSYGYDLAKSFIDEFIQTNFYTTLLIDYNISFDETFESILTFENDFKSRTLKQLLDAFTLNQSMEPLLKTMQNNCPLYLPLDQINLQRGLQLVKKDDRESLMKSLEFLSKSKLDKNVINRFNSLSFFYGSAYLIRSNFDFSYEEAVTLFKESIKCKKAFNYCLEDQREMFLFPFFEAALEIETFSSCICCDSNNLAVDLISIDTPLFKIFLKDFQHKNEKAYNLYWKYLLFRNMKIEAVECLINLSHRSDLALLKKIDFLETALSISTGTHLFQEVKLKLKLYEIQKELMERQPTMKTAILLDSDTLFNDYCQDHIDLKIKILDAINFKDENVIKDLFSQYFATIPLRECFMFLGDLENANLDIVFDILSEKAVNSGVDFCNGLTLAGFSYEKIVEIVKEKLRSSTVHPDIKIELLKSLRVFSKQEEYKEIEQFCKENYGIRVYK